MLALSASAVCNSTCMLEAGCFGPDRADLCGGTCRNDAIVNTCVIMMVTEGVFSVYVCVLCMCVCMHVCVCVSMVYMCLYVCTYVCVCVCAVCMCS